MINENLEIIKENIEKMQNMINPDTFRCDEANIILDASERMAAEVEQTKEQLISKEKSISLLQSWLNKSEKMNEGLKALGKEMADEIASLKAEINNYLPTTFHDTEIDMISEWSDDEKISLISRLLRYNNYLGAANIQRLKREGEIKHLNAELEKQKDRADEQGRNACELFDVIKTLQADNSILSTETVNLKSNENFFKTKIADLETQKVKRENHVLSLEQIISKLKAELERRPEVVMCVECKAKEIGLTCPIKNANAIIYAKTGLKDFILTGDCDFCSNGVKKESEGK